jgi:hypothetical protein
MAIERFVWTAHAEDRRVERRLDHAAVERAIRDGHRTRQINNGRADWLVRGALAEDRRFTVVYDHPHGADRAAVCIVSVWPSS